MATMVKEKKRQKKRTKEKSTFSSTQENDELHEEIERFNLEENICFSGVEHSTIEKSTENPDEPQERQHQPLSSIQISSHSIISSETESLAESVHAEVVDTKVRVTWETNKNQKVTNSGVVVSYKCLNETLNKMREEKEKDIQSLEEKSDVDITTPSAPILEEQIQGILPNKIVKTSKPKVQCMRLEEAMWLYGGIEMTEVKTMSEKEEMIVEAGPKSGPEHPLVDLLSTFRSSLLAVEREKIEISHKLIEEEKLRTSVWRIEKRNADVSEQCACGAYVTFRARYDDAEFLKEKVPAARMRLEALLRDVQESYCHHQHTALLTFCQIEDVISETVQSNKEEIREALSLVLQALRLSDRSSGALSTALLRWARALVAALLDGRDFKQLLFLLHHLFRQTRSVRWATRLIQVSVGDSVDAARTIALLDLVLAGSRLNAAVECTEEIEDLWEEVDEHGSGAVGEGVMRERDLLAMLNAFPLRDLVARITLFSHRDVSEARPEEWGDRSGGHGVVRAACGARALLAVLLRAALTHPQYQRLRRRLHTLALRTLHALAALHMHTRTCYTESLEVKITAELEACFVAGLTLLDASRSHELPATLLGADTAKEYCISLIASLHDPTTQIQSLQVDSLSMSCGERVRCVTQASIDRDNDYELARIVLDFLFQAGIRRKAMVCKGSCDGAARECLPRLLASHPYLHITALHMVADVYAARLWVKCKDIETGQAAVQSNLRSLFTFRAFVIFIKMENLEASTLEPLSISIWRASSGELRLVLDDWARRSAPLLQYLLLKLDYSPHTGLSLDSQLAIGSWLCQHVQGLPGDAPEWAWQVLRKLRVHRSCWGFPLEAPSPESDPTDLFSTAYAILSSSWGHCIPLICDVGISGLCRLAAVRPRDATHCLATVMLVMAHSPDSVSLTPKFTDLFSTLLGSGPTLVQRALGRGPISGHTLLLQLLLTQLSGYQRSEVPRSSLLSAWLHAVWKPTLPPSATSLLDTVMLSCRDWPQLDAHTAFIVQSENSKEQISHCVRNAASAPLLCESVLRVTHALREVKTLLYQQLLLSLQHQQRNGKKIHVDNALKQIDPGLSSEDLVIYRTAAAALVAPLQHPSHLTLWRLFFHLYLQRPLANGQDPVTPAGPLFFSGITKSRTLAQIKKRLQDTATYHHNEAETLKTGQQNEERPKSQASTSKSVKAASNIDDNLLPSLTIVDFTGESSGSSSSDNSSESESDEDRDKCTEDTTQDVKKEDVRNLINYHLAAEKLVREYLCWAEAGEKVRAEPHQADLARYIPESALSVAWERESSRNSPPSPLSPTEESFQPSFPCPPPTSHKTPFQYAVDALLKIKPRSVKRSRRRPTKSLTENINFKDSRAVLAEVDKHLKNIEELAHEWSLEADRISSLDRNLWELVPKLRVSRPLPPITKSCPKHCRPITVALPYREWCISTGIEQGIRENRTSARQALRRLARARPHAARTAAALHALARRVGGPTALSVVERAWRSAGRPGQCAPAHLALTNLVTYLAEGRVCAEVLSRWGRCGTALQVSLCGALVSPRQLAAADWPLLYTALLHTQLPDHALFSYLSRFELGRWSEHCEPAQRRALLEALTAAAQRWGPNPDAQHHVLLELFGVHSAALVTGRELCECVCACARASASLRLPPAHWSHVARAVTNTAHQVPFDQLGHLLRELGVVWWEARTGLQGAGQNSQYEAYAPHIADVLYALQRAFVAAAVKLTYEPEKVGWFAWSGLQEAWSPWVSPLPAAPPLLRCSGRDVYTPALRHFVDTLHQSMLDCPGSEMQVLRLLWEWTIQCHTRSAGSGCQESELQSSTLLAELTKLPWTEHQWFHVSCLQTALQVCASGDAELRAWCADAVRDVTCATWLCGATDVTLAPHLAALLTLFLTLPLSIKTLEEAAGLPWGRLPEPAFQAALERFFSENHNTTVPYHGFPQFRVVGYASEMCGPASGTGRSKRLCWVSLWTRAAAAPAHLSLAPITQATILDTIQLIGERAEEVELEELLGRALVILCIEPAAAAVLPVWEKWVSTCDARCARVVVRALAVLTAPEYFAPLADRAVQALLDKPECGGWSEISVAWRACPWSDPGALVRRGRMLAAYGAGLAAGDLQPAIDALLDTHLHFDENEVIACVWVCAACRAGEGGARVIARWGEEPRRSILKMVTMQQDRSQPTPRIRLLCRLAQCILTPGADSAVRAYETCCTTVLGSNPGEVITWGRNPHPRKLPRLAIRLFPKHEIYFKEEWNMTPEENV